MSHRSITGKHFSRKTGTIHPFESALERDWLIHLEYDNEVLSYTTQPITIRYIKEGIAASYTPDVIVYYLEELKRKPLLCEVKYEEELVEKQEYYAHKFQAASNYANNNGWSFETITENRVRTVYLENIKLLSRYHDAKINEDLAAIITGKLKMDCFLEIDQVVSYNAPQLLYTVWQLLAAQRIGCDMNSKITMKTLIWNR